ncbi:MAG: protein-disulfide reductase DsbD family protein [Methylovulum sp.]|nr:protein-disulfide reductase DsbD family protein [Methylovulum sp.]
MGKHFLFCWLLFLASSTYAAGTQELLQPDEAFVLTSTAKTPGQLELSWHIADGYYLYRDKIKFISLTPSIKVQDATFPKGQTKHDPFFGEVEIYRDYLAVQVPLLCEDLTCNTLDLEVNFQGCAEAGVCYLPVRQTLSFDWSEKKFDWWGLFSASGNFTPFISELGRPRPLCHCAISKYGFTSPLSEICPTQPEQTSLFYIEFVGKMHCNSQRSSVEFPVYRNRV